MAKWYSVVWTYHILFTHLSVDGHMIYLWFLVIMNNAAMNIYVPIFVWTISSLGYIPRTRFSGSCSNFILNILKNSKNIFQSRNSILHSHQQYMRIPVSPHPVIVLFFFFFKAAWHSIAACQILIPQLGIELMAPPVEPWSHWTTREVPCHPFWLKPPYWMWNSISSWYWLAFSTWFKAPTPWKRPWCWERLKAKGEEGNRGWDS